MSGSRWTRRCVLGALVFVLGVFALGACDSTPSPDTSTSMDTGVSDSSTADVGGDTTTSVDMDGDGIVATLDCDDGDATVGGSLSRPCATFCGAGTETCTDAVWAECDAGTDCACDTEGAMRTVDCARCGTQAQMCTAGIWIDTSTCVAQGDCEAGEVETEIQMFCGERQRVCQSSCAWTDWTQLVEMGSCNPGDRFCGGSNRACAADCMWVVFGTREECEAFEP